MQKIHEKIITDGNEQFTVNAFWDDEAQVWAAASDRVRGLATEAETVNARCKIEIHDSRAT